MQILEGEDLDLVDVAGGGEIALDDKGVGLGYGSGGSVLFHCLCRCVWV